jgi:hypothetical protein
MSSIEKVAAAMGAPMCFTDAAACNARFVASLGARSRAFRVVRQIDSPLGQLSTQFKQHAEASTLNAALALAENAVVAHAALAETKERVPRYVVEPHASFGARTNGEETIYMVDVTYSLGLILRADAAALDGAPVVYAETHADIAEGVSNMIHANIKRLNRMAESSLGGLGTTTTNIVFALYPTSIVKDIDERGHSLAERLVSLCGEARTNMIHYSIAKQGDGFEWVLVARPGERGTSLEDLRE